MADDWIKFRKKLPRDPRVLVASRKCHATRVTVCGALVALWCLADDFAEDSGLLPGYTPEDIDREVEVPGFCLALPPDWFELRGDAVYLPNYQEHNGATARARAQTTSRQRRKRVRDRVSATASRTRSAETVTREEKRREEEEEEYVAPAPTDLSHTLPGGGGVGAGGCHAATVTGCHADTVTPGGFARGMPCDHPEQAAQAKRVVEAYQREVAPAHTRRGGVEAVLALLLAGHPADDLCRAADAYAAWCGRQEKAPQHRQCVKTFYAEGTFAEYLAAPPDAPPPGDDLAARTLRDRDRDARERADACGPDETRRILGRQNPGEVNL